MKPCNQCGKCCEAYSDGGLSATTSEIEWWETHRPEIHRYVSQGKIWISPDTGKQLQRCPWLTKLTEQNKYICEIYADRPEDCKHYPVSIDDMIRDGCEMIEVKDLAKPSQAQQRLDEIMSDSRPAFGRRPGTT